MFYVYILYSKTIDRYYVGSTNNLTRRINEHNNPLSRSKYTAKVSDWIIVLQAQAGETRSEAVMIERYIKKQKSRKYIEDLIGKFNGGTPLAQLVRVPTSRD